MLTAHLQVICVVSGLALELVVEQRRKELLIARASQPYHRLTRSPQRRSHVTWKPSSVTGADTLWRILLVCPSELESKNLYRICSVGSPAAYVVADSKGSLSLKELPSSAQLLNDTCGMGLWQVRVLKSTQETMNKLLTQDSQYIEEQQNVQDALTIKECDISASQLEEWRKH